MDAAGIGFLDLVDRGLEKVREPHFIFDELRYEIDLRRRGRQSRDDREFYELVRDALNRGWDDVVAWEKRHRDRACVRSLLDRIDWELRLQEMGVLVAA